MVVGICTVYLNLPAAQSLKEKRGVVKSLIARVRNEFNVSIAEVDANDYCQSAILGIVCVSNGKKRVESVLTAVVRTIERSRLDIIVTDFEMELV